MDQYQFDTLIAKLEQQSLQRPRAYLLKVLLVAALGFVVLGVALLFALLPLAALIGLGVLVVATGGKALIFVLKFGKLLILLLIPTWVMLKSSVQMLFSRFPKPEGRELSAAEAPALFKRIDELKRRAHGPAIHRVLLTQELNAAIVQHPRFGLLGWEENYLILGLPLLQVLSEPEALAVVAHEYGHLSGHHSRLGGFIYRMRSTWGRLQEMSEQWQDWGSRLITKLFRQYAPYFNAYTFVYARRNEYIADSVSVELVGVQETANALMRTQIAAQFESEVFWPDIDKFISAQAEPISNRSQQWGESISTKLDEDLRVRYLEVASRFKTDNFDTHPSLADRLNAIGVVPDSTHAQQLSPITESAAEVWLANQYQAISQEFDLQWQKNVEGQWQQRHQYLCDKQKEFAGLSIKDPLTKDERWQLLMLSEELNSDIDISEQLNAFVTEFPEHLQARYRHGIFLLNNGDERGVAEIEYVMSQEMDAILSGCEAAIGFYKDKQPEKAEEYRRRWISRNEYLQSVNNEFANLPSDAILVEHGLDDEMVNRLRELVTGNTDHINKIYLLRRILKSDPKLHDYVFAFEISGWTLGDKSADILKRMSLIEMPFSAFFVNLKSSTYKTFRARIKKLGVLPLYTK